MMTLSKPCVLVGVLGLAAATTVAAQQPQERPAAKPAVDVEAAPSAAFSYDPQSRRDPFVSLVARGNDNGASTRPKGPMGLLIGEVTVKGIVRDRSGFIAMIQGPDQKTFIVRSGEKLMDGTVKAITADTVVFSQDVTDPMSMVKQKEVRKAVRSADGGRG
jgi:Tfp pilus assembly protein PilP